MTRHRESDLAHTDSEIKKRDDQYAATLKRQVKKIKKWLAKNDDKPGKSGDDRKGKNRAQTYTKCYLRLSGGVVEKAWGGRFITWL